MCYFSLKLNGTTDGALDEYSMYDVSNNHTPPINESTSDESSPPAKHSTSKADDHVTADGGSDCQDGDDESPQDNLLDTVGAVCVDMDGHIVSAVSSGGIILKQPGRLGQVLCHIFVYITI